MLRLALGRSGIRTELAEEYEPGGGGCNAPDGRDAMLTLRGTVHNVVGDTGEGVWVKS